MPPAQLRVKLVLLPRNKGQEAQIRSDYPGWFEGGKTVVPQGAVDGLNLLWHSDLVVSGGGTMNREAAALGIPVYSIFRGKIGAVDRQLQKEGRLLLIERAEEVKTRIRLEPRVRQEEVSKTPRQALFNIVSHVSEIFWIENGHGAILASCARTAKL